MGASEPLDVERRMREFLWLHHGHEGLYGDDGEMQCNTPPRYADFKRAEMADLLRHCELAVSPVAAAIAAHHEKES